MWLFGKNCLFSTVQHFENPNVIHVHTRFKDNLKRLCKIIL